MAASGMRELLSIGSLFIAENITENATYLDYGLTTNSSGNFTTVNGSYILITAKATVLGLLILITVIGNVFVIAAILLERNLQNIANYLIVSLAVADLMVACLVMPLAAVYAISEGWILGPELCKMWTAIDVLCCTASIFHLLAIAIDRYWAVTNVDYIHKRNLNRIGCMILVIWMAPLAVSLAQFTVDDSTRVEDTVCLPSQDVVYQLFATFCSFYGPLLAILILYWKIFQIARSRIRKNRPKAMAETPSHHSLSARHIFSKNPFRSLKESKQSSATEALVSSLALVEGQSTITVNAVAPDEITENQKGSDGSGETARTDEIIEHRPANTEQQETTAFTISHPTKNISPEKSSTTNNGSATSHQSDMSRIEIIRSGNPTTKYGTAAAVVKAAVNPMQIRKEKKETLEAKRERKAAKTLAIITGAFVICWLPFFILAPMMPICDNCVPEKIFTLALWLGYFNSTLNPIIYTIFSPEFRQAFRRMLCGTPRRNPYYMANSKT